VCTLAHSINCSLLLYTSCSHSTASPCKLTSTTHNLLHLLLDEHNIHECICIQIVPRRAGDVESLYTDPAFASQYLNWKATRGLKEMCADTWRWQSTNPNGYKTGDENTDEHTAPHSSEKSAVSVSASGSLRATSVSSGNTVPVRGGLKQL
jgi:hypothetical protein